MNMFRTPESRILFKNTKMSLVHRSLTPGGNLGVESSEVARVAKAEVARAIKEEEEEEATIPPSSLMVYSTLSEEELRLRGICTSMEDIAKYARTA
jgi:hypothetical protein